MNNTNMHKRLNIAIIGSGVAGITAAYILQQKHDVTLFEKNQYVGGHTNTIVIDKGPDAGTAIDTGFIVLNDRTYPNLHTLLERLNVKVRNSDMSFGLYCQQKGLQYAGTNLAGIFSDYSNIFSVSYWCMLRDVVRFNTRGKEDLQNGLTEGKTLGEYLEQLHFSEEFINDYLVPMGSAIWSTPSDKMFDFPATTFLRFFDNHGLLSLNDRPQWQTVAGGGYQYVKSFLNTFKGHVELNSHIKSVWRDENGVMLHFEDGRTRAFDYVVFAVHADQVLPLLENPTNEERALLGCWRYTKNHTILHTDISVMPPNRRAWASWNYTREAVETQQNPLSITYHMNRLQGLRTTQNYFVTLNRQQAIDPQHIIREFEYMHPSYSMETLQTQPQLQKLQGINNTFYCGSYFGYGFHEDAVKSGVKAAEAFGLQL